MTSSSARSLVRSLRTSRDSAAVPTSELEWAVPSINHPVTWLASGLLQHVLVAGPKSRQWAALRGKRCFTGPQARTVLFSCFLLGGCMVDAAVDGDAVSTRWPCILIN
jgi:hypothetical protein